MTTSRWFEQRKDFFFKEVVREYVRNVLFCRDLLETCRREGQLPFARMDYWVGTEMKRGPLWQLKDTCHSRFRNSQAHCGTREYLFDWAIGSAFHSAMKLKEDVYLLTSYRLRHDALEGCADPVSLKRLEKCRLTTDKIARTLVRQLQEIAGLLAEASHQMRDLLADQRHNMLLMRYLVEEEADVERVWGAGALTAIFSDIFPGRVHLGYCIAAQSYLEGGWYKDAHHAFQRALELNPKSVKARRGLSHTRRLLNI